jgi:hypothetical protein
VVGRTVVPTLQANLSHYVTNILCEQFQMDFQVTALFSVYVAFGSFLTNSELIMTFEDKVVPR